MNTNTTARTRTRTRTSKAERKAMRLLCEQIANTPDTTVVDRWGKRFPARSYTTGETRVWFPKGRVEQFANIFAAGYTFAVEAR